MSHLSRDEMHRWQEEGPASERGRMISHLASCAGCRSQFATLVRQGPETEVPSSVRPEEVVWRGYAAFPRRQRRAVAFWLPAAAALGITVLWLGGRDRPIAPASEGVRGDEVQLLAPAGPVVRLTEFRWTSPVRAASFRLEVRDAEDRVVHSTTVREERVLVPGALRELLKPAAPYRWRVAALDAGGGVIVSSPFQAFSITSSP